VPQSGRPIFLKIVYHGPKAMEELVAYDPHLVVGVLGGASGTTHDAFALLEQAKKDGARAALFGRKINNSEDQLTFVRFLRMLADGQISAEEAVRAYHGELAKLKLKPYRDLKDDLELTTTATSYAGSGSMVSLSQSSSAKPQAAVKTGVVASPWPDFSKMTSAEKVAYARKRIKNDLSGNSNGNAAKRGRA
jgi:hypothetical protein